jgi:hypothetical protein
MSLRFCRKSRRATAKTGEVEVVRMKPENLQESGDFCKIAANDPFQVGHSAAPPVLKMLRREQAQVDEYVHRRYDLPVLQNGLNRAFDVWIERIFPIGGERDRRLPGLPGKLALLFPLIDGHHSPPRNPVTILSIFAGASQRFAFPSKQKVSF